LELSSFVLNGKQGFSSPRLDLLFAENIHEFATKSRRSLATLGLVNRKMVSFINVSTLKHRTNPATYYAMVFFKAF